MHCTTGFALPIGKFLRLGATRLLNTPLRFRPCLLVGAQEFSSRERCFWGYETKVFNSDVDFQNFINI